MDSISIFSIRQDLQDYQDILFVFRITHIALFNFSQINCGYLVAIISYLAGGDWVFFVSSLPTIASYSGEAGGRKQRIINPINPADSDLSTNSLPAH